MVTLLQQWHKCAVWEKSHNLCTFRNLVNNSLERGVKLGSIVYQWIHVSVDKANCSIHWIVIYLVNSIFHPLNNWGMVELNEVSFTVRHISIKAPFHSIFFRASGVYWMSQNHSCWGTCVGYNKYLIIMQSWSNFSSLLGLSVFFLVIAFFMRFSLPLPLSFLPLVLLEFHQCDWFLFCPFCMGALGSIARIWQQADSV